MKEEALTIPEIFHASAALFPDKVALQAKRDGIWQKFTYRQAQEYALKVCGFLLREGLGKNDCVGLILENRPEWAIIYLGIVQAGLTCVPLDPQLSAEEIKNLFSDSGVKTIFCSYEVFNKKISQVVRAQLHKIIILDAPGLSASNLVDFSDIGKIPAQKDGLPHVYPQDTASLIYTSGTTAQPKGVVLAHANFCANFRSIKKLGICKPADNILAILPLYHTYAFMVTLLVPLGMGAQVTYVLSFKPLDIMEAIKDAKVTILVGVPQFFFLLHRAVFERIKKIPVLFLPLAVVWVKFTLRKHWFKCLRLMASGGARLDPKIGRELSGVTGVKMLEGYGLTETSPVATFNPPQKIKMGSVGISIPDVEIKILNPDAEGIGQVLIKGPNVMQGYFKHQEMTAQVIKDGWFYSGDLGRLDDEGYLFLAGREKEVIVLTSGKNIYPEDLEAIYGKSPYIKEICIISRAEERFGGKIESLHAVVVPNLDYFRQKNETDIRGRVRWEMENLGRSLPSYQHIMGFTITKEELPRTALKKIKRYLVKQKYSGEAPLPGQPKENIIPEEDLRGLEREFAQKIVNYVFEQLNKPVDLDSHLEVDLGIDSFGRVELGLGLERLLKIKVPDDLVSGVSTVRELISALLRIIEQPLISKAKAEGIEEDWAQILAPAPQENMLKKIKISPGLLARSITFIFQVIFLFIFRTFWLLRVKGAKNLPPEGPYLICPNHSSYLDGFIVFSSLPLKQALKTFFLGYSDIFEQPLIVGASRIARLIPIDPYKHFTDALQAASFVLANKKIVCIFPEGRRSIDGSIGEFKKGVGILVKELGIPVVPAYIKGSYNSWPRYRILPRPYPLKVIFGKPLSAQELKTGAPPSAQADEYSAITQKIREAVLSLGRQ